MNFCFHFLIQTVLSDSVVCSCKLQNWFSLLGLALFAQHCWVSIVLLQADLATFSLSFSLFMLASG